MRVDRIDANLRGALGDNKGTFYNDQMRRTAIGEAVKAYSQYKPLKRRFGYGNLLTDYPIGSTQIAAMGGPYYPGDSIIIDAFTPLAETILIDDVDITDAAELYLSGDAYLLTLDSATANKHRGGCTLSKTLLGLTLVQGQDTYVLPYDWIVADQASFDIAVGARSYYVRQGGFYDSVAMMSAAFEQGGRFGSNQNFIGNAFGYGVDPNAQYPGAPIGTETTYFFEDGNPPILRVTPGPSFIGQVDFEYLAVQTLSTLPDNCSDKILLYAKWYCLQARAAFLAARMDYSEDDIHETGTANANALQKLADDTLKEWYLKVRRPVIMSG